ncbi:uncharacterized protein LACBIDRAFT_332293 [Laccaria bicolor S238N-H82]|uniref:Predicted protein n=1 Tax=Laccaria bicolor (strain S238N-H82 / ATCC MYA-4686) TaxID=486041 RepID=B0DS86_LACBS|nr:uncharacterized protein LACBIDRAFT_332293 [Laccaria bicolor S238N-H82]EDR02429.1 predicted protein [Laccaria bicolor S238N-H82]|eukprot:XP_001886792.1 predicted protein [Laccaria bicolor S238N-H82]
MAQISAAIDPGAGCSAAFATSVALASSTLKTILSTFNIQNGAPSKEIRSFTQCKGAGLWATSRYTSDSWHFAFTSWDRLVSSPHPCLTERCHAQALAGSGEYLSLHGNLV